MNEFEFELFFDDITILEANGYYDEVVSIMENEEFSKDWMLRSNLTINSPFCISSMVCHFYYNGNIIIKTYNNDTSDIYNNIDIKCLMQWANDRGWKRIEPHFSVVQDNILFWKHQWEVDLIKSEYLERKFGKNSNNYISSKENDIDSDDDIE